MTIGVIGIGKLGLCFALNLERAGFSVRGLDANEQHVLQVNNKTLRSTEPNVEALLSESKDFHATASFDEFMSSGWEVAFIVVATPSLPHGGYDHSQVDTVLSKIGEYGRSKLQKHLVVMCTTMPGYCDRVAGDIESLNYTLNYNPEFIAQGTVIQDQQFPDQVLIGESTEESGLLVQKIYEQMCQNEPVYCRMSRISAELTKLATNCFLTTKISFANSIGDLATMVGAEADKVLSAIGSDSRIGNKYLGYGFGYGGPCFPRDNRALMKFGRENDFEVLISEVTDKVNRRHLEFQFRQYMEKYIPGEVIEFDHVTYKAGTTILEESQQLALAVKLANAGRKVSVREYPDTIKELKQLYGDLFIYISRR